MVTQRIRRIHTTKLEPGESDPGAAEGLMLLGNPKVYLLSSGRQVIVRFYWDDTELPDPAWSPDDEASLEIWLDASDAATVTDAGSGKVSLLADKAGSTDFAQTDAAQRPTTGTRTQNSLNVIDFAEAENFDFTTYTWPSSSFQFVFAAALDTVNFTDDSLIRGGGGASWFRFKAGGGSEFNNYLQLFGASNQFADGSSAGDTKGAFHIYRLVFNFATNTIQVYVDGALAGEDTDGYQTAINGTELHLFGYDNTIDTADGAFAELHHFADAGSTIGQKAEGYLAHKWGITLDAGHPYFSAAP